MTAKTTTPKTSLRQPKASLFARIFANDAPHEAPHEAPLVLHPATTAVEPIEPHPQPMVEVIPDRYFDFPTVFVVEVFVSVLLGRLGIFLSFLLSLCLI